MTKRELIEHLESLDAPDDTPVFLWIGNTTGFALGRPHLLLRREKIIEFQLNQEVIEKMKQAVLDWFDEFQ